MDFKPEQVLTKEDAVEFSNAYFACLSKFHEQILQIINQTQPSATSPRPNQAYLYSPGQTNVTAISQNIVRFLKEANDKFYKWVGELIQKKYDEFTKHKVDKIKIEIEKKYEEQLEFKQKTIYQMASDYIKELKMYRDKELSGNKISESINVHLFTPTKLLDQNLCTILNNSIQETKNAFEERIKRLFTENQRLQQAIACYKKYAPEEYDFIGKPLKEIFTKIYGVEKDPRKLWTAMESAFGVNYFSEIVGSQYTISEEDIKEMVINQLHKWEADTTSFIKQIKAQYDEEISGLKAQLAAMNEGMVKYKQDKEKELELISTSYVQRQITMEAHSKLINS